MKQKLLAYGLPKETVTAITKLNKNTNVNVRSPDGDTDFFDIVALYLFIICRDYGIQASIDLINENDFKPKKARSRRYPTENIMNADNVDDIALLENALNRAK